MLKDGGLCPATVLPLGGIKMGGCFPPPFGKHTTKKKRMYILIIAMPLIGATIAGLMGRKVGEKGAGYIASINMIITTFMA